MSEASKQMSPGRNNRVLFLCTGNYYRSRFAEILFNSVAPRQGLAWEADSRGLAVERGYNNIGPIANSVVQVLEELKILAEGMVSRFPLSATLDDFKQADAVIALQRDEHLPLLEERFPAWAEKVEFWHVEDSPGALPLIEVEVMNLVARILADNRTVNSPAHTSIPNAARDSQ